MGVEPSVKADLVGPCPERRGESPPVGGMLKAAQLFEHQRQAHECLVVPGVVAMHDPPERIRCDLKVEPIVPARRVVKIPCVNRVRAFHQPVAWIPARVIVQDILQRKLDMGQHGPHPLVVPGGLPCQEHRIDKAVFDVRLDRHPHILGPVLPLARELVGRVRKIVEQPSPPRLRFRKMIHHALHVGFPVPESAHHIRMISEPQARTVGRPVAPD